MQRAADGADRIGDRAGSAGRDRHGGGQGQRPADQAARAAPSIRWPRLSTTFPFGTTGDRVHGIMSADVRVELALITRMDLMSVDNRYPSLVMSAVAGVTPALFPRRAVPCVL